MTPSRIRILWLLVVLGLLIATPSQAEFRLGIQGGLNSTKFSGDTPKNFSYTSRSGFMVGAIGDFRLSEDAWLSLQPMYQQRGTNSEVAVQGATEPVPGSTVEADYFALPVLVRIFAGNDRLYALGGLNLGFLSSVELVDTEGNREDVQDFFTDIDVAMDFGIGYLFPVRRALVNLELRYEQGLLNLASNEADSEESTIPYRLRSAGFQFLAGIIWPLGGK